MNPQIKIDIRTKLTNLLRVTNSMRIDAMFGDPQLDTETILLEIEESLTEILTLNGIEIKEREQWGQ